MTRATLPDLSAAEHIRYGVALNLAGLASNIAALLLFGAGWHGLIAWGVTVPFILLASGAVVRRWARRRGRSLITGKRWNEAQTAAQDSCAVSVTHGFLFGFAVLGAASAPLAVSDSPDWADRVMAGAIGAAVGVLFAMPCRKSKDLRG